GGGRPGDRSQGRTVRGMPPVVAGDLCDRATFPPLSATASYGRDTFGEVRYRAGTPDLIRAVRDHFGQSISQFPQWLHGHTLTATTPGRFGRAADGRVQLERPRHLIE